jgi:hypothetical protein
VDIPVEYGSEYEKELDESVYVAAEEFIYPDFPVDDDSQPQGEFLVSCLR